jgi:N-acetylmuramoyl-L-alanine amidase
VVIDPGHGGRDRGARVPGRPEVDEARLAEDLAARVEGRLAASGVVAHLTRGRLRPGDRAPDDSERAAVANRLDADLVISVHCDASTDRLANGVATYYYGNRALGVHSAVGETFAGLVQDEIVARTGLLDCRTHGKTWGLLRHTVMPAVRIEVGYLSHPQDAAQLADPAFRDLVAESIVAAVQRLAEPADDDRRVVRLPDLVG